MGEAEVRILLLTLYFKPDMAANAVIMTELAEDLAKLGHQITVITSMPHYHTNRIWEEYRGKLVQHDKHGPIDISACTCTFQVIEDDSWGGC